MNQNLISFRTAEAEWCENVSVREVLNACAEIVCNLSVQNCVC